MKKNLTILFAFFTFPVDASTLKIPAGFEILSQGMQERVDVIVAGKHIGFYDAIVSLDGIKFINPESVLTALQLSVKPDDKDYKVIRQLLNNTFPRNDILACTNAQQSKGCGFIASKSIDVIYDSSEGSVTLFIRKEWLADAERNDLYIKPTTNNVVNAFIHQQDMNVIVQDDYSNFFIQGAGALGISDNSYIGGDWSFSAAQNEDESNNEADLNDLYYRYDISQRYYSQLGRMDNRMLFNSQGGSFNFSFLPLGAIDGVRIGTTLSYLNREVASQGTPLNVLLTRNSRVDAYRNDQLLGTFYLSPRNQSIDTSLFPSGSYSVQLRIYESNQLVRTENSPFSKTGSLDDGSIHWFAQGGKITDSDTNENTAFQAGLRVPFTPALSFTVGSAAVQSNTYAETGFDYSPDLGLAGTPNFNGRVFRSSDGNKGDSEQLSWSVGDWPSLSIYRYSSSGDDCSDSGQNDNNDYTSQSCYESINTTLTSNVLSWNLMFGYIQTQNHASDDMSWQRDKSFEDNILEQTTEESTSRTLQFSASRAFTQADWVYNGTFGLFRRDDDGYDGIDNGVYLSLTLSQAPRQDNLGKSQSTRLSTDYRDSQDQSSQLSYNVSHSWYRDQNQHKELTLEAGGINTDTLDTGLSGRMEGQYGNVSAVLSDSYDNEYNKHTSAFSGSWSSSFAASTKGVHWGSAGISEPASAVLVNIDDLSDEDDGIAIDAQVSGNRTAHISRGGSALFPTTGFEPTTVAVSDSSAPLNTDSSTNILNGAGERNIMLLPGKMRLRSVVVEHRYGYIGQLILPQSASNNIIIGLNSKMLMLSDDGGFTAEMATKAPALYLLSGDVIYQCPLQIKKQRGTVRYVGESSCQLIKRDSLPAEVNEQLLVKLKSRRDIETASNKEGDE